VDASPSSAAVSPAAASRREPWWSDRPRLFWFAGVVAALLVLVAHWFRAPGAPAREGVALAFDYLTKEATPPDRVFVAGVLAAVLVWLVGRPRTDTSRLRSAAEWVAACLYAAAFYWAVRETRHELGDGPGLLRDPVHIVVGQGFYTCLDEAAGMWVPVRMAQSLYRSGTPAVPALELSYQVVSVGAGVLFTGVVALAAARAPQRYLFATLLLINAYARIFAGYLENYSVCTALLGGLFLVAAGGLRDEDGARPWHVALVAAVAAVAVSFHAVAVWCVFPLAYYAITAVRRVGALRRVGIAATAMLVGLAVLGAAYLLFTRWLTVGIDFAHASRPHLRDEVLRAFHDRTWAEHRMVVAKVALPAIVLIALGALAAPRATLTLLRARDVHFALLWLLGFGVHQAFWISTIGLRKDWDLFGTSWLPLAYLAWRVTVGVCKADRKTDVPVLVATYALALVGGLSFVATAMR